MTAHLPGALRDNRDRSWMVDAECTKVDPDWFFTDRGESTDAAKKVCAHCPVRIECLDYALAGNEKFGIWGGASERERRRIRRQRKQRAA